MNDLDSEVRSVFADVTRYPLDILEPEASLEEDLGIDSVKLGEVFSVLRERYSLPRDLDIPLEKLGSIAGVTQALKGFIAARSRGGTPLPVSAATNGSGIAHGETNGGTDAAAVPSHDQTKGDLIREVTAVFAEVTRYPEEILEPRASLEEDLGIDSVKLGEVFSVLRERYSLPQELDIPRERLRTIAGLTQVLEGYVSSPVSPAENAAMPPAGAANGLSSDASSLPAAIAPATPGGTAAADLVEELRSVFAEVTRYPKEILDPEAGLEEDLGIDSVKLGEVFSVLREKYNLPSEMDIPREQLGSISGVAAALRGHLPAQPDNRPTKGAPAEAVTVSPPSGNVEDELIQVFAEVTRYPKEILDPEAGLEEDLGIDSVKLGEVFSVLRERYRLPEELEVPSEKLRTIRDLAAALGAYLGGELSSSEGEVTSPPPALVSEAVNGQTAAVQGQPAAPVAVSTSGPAALYEYEKPAGKPFTGKVAYVSGSGRGLGKDIAAYLGELGATVIVNSFHSRARGEQAAEEIRERGGDAIHLWGSMANPAHIGRVFDEIEERYDVLDFFIGNASNGMLARLEDLTVEHWEKAYRTNVVGLHQSALRAVKLMRRRGGGKIITLSSPASHGYVDYFGCMGAVKAAVESLTRSMAIEFAQYNIQVNCVSPGPVYGELLNKWPESARLVPQWESNTAYHRLCEVRDVSHFIAYLLSEPVKLFTGSVLVMDGGISSQGW